ncbi:MAG: hypothetical protein RXN77_07505 [Sulfolobaceae archaeon]|nr:hypothetical protein [Sulfolobales archaeon]
MPKKALTFTSCAIWTALAHFFMNGKSTSFPSPALPLSSTTVTVSPNIAYLVST